MPAFYDALLWVLWQRPFFRCLHRELLSVAHERTRPLVSRARSDTQRVLDEQGSETLDPQARSVHVMCSMILASYQTLLAEFDPGLAHEVVRRAFLGTRRRPAQWIVRAALRRSRDPIAALSGALVPRILERAYGRMVRFDRRTSREEVELLVTHCGYSQFFVDHGQPTLARIVCEWDRAWMDVVNHSREPLRVQRSKAIAVGSEHCSFRFVRAIRSGNAPPDVVLHHIDDFREGDSPRGVSTRSKLQGLEEQFPASDRT